MAVKIAVYRSEAQEGGGDDTMQDFGPFEFVQVTYGTVRCDEDGPIFYFDHTDGCWHTDPATIAYTDLTVSDV